jgi:formate hydrogenlyase subunit 3/multisubunit Na+/H+ antiporter MnhD subunit
MTALPLLVIAVPLLLAALVPWRGAVGRGARAVTPLAALPGLVLAVLPAPPPPVEHAWLLLGARVGVDVTGQVFLLLTALLWTLAGAYARAHHAGDPERGRLHLFWLLTLAGNLGLAVAGDVVSFYLAFALMTFSAYGLVIHTGGAAALRAGRVYIVMAVAGEALLLAGILLGAAAADGVALDAFARGVAVSPHRDLVVALLLAGFGIKAGALPLHVWLPLAHPVAPTPASAVLSGSMIKAGLLGWLRFLPLGVVALPGWGMALAGMGLAAAVFGVAAGATQRDPKTALAYSSISQMGFLNVAVGIGLAAPDAWPYALSAALVYAVHHGLAKGALFLGVGVAAAVRGRTERRLVLGGLTLAALAVAGAPLTSGSIAKTALKGAAARVPEWPLALDVLLPLAAVGTTLLMGRFLMLVARRPPGEAHGRPTALVVPWVLLLAAVGAVLWAVPGRYELEMDAPYLPDAGSLWLSVWPLVAGALLLWTLVQGARRLRLPPERVAVTPGDLLVPLERVVGAVRRVPLRLRAPANPVLELAARWHGVYAESAHGDVVARVERGLTRWEVAAALLAVLAAALAGLLVMRGGG